MRFLKTKDLRSTIAAMFSVSTAPPPTLSQQVAHLDRIRGMMLAMTELTPSERSEALAHRIRYAASVESLWYARGELMAQLARVHGEAIAREKVAALSEMFTELLPSGLRSRPSPLDGPYRSGRPAPKEG